MDSHGRSEQTGSSSSISSSTGFLTPRTGRKATNKQPLERPFSPLISLRHRTHATSPFPSHMMPSTTRDDTDAAEEGGGGARGVPSSGSVEEPSAPSTRAPQHAPEAELLPSSWWRPGRWKRLLTRSHRRTPMAAVAASSRKWDPAIRRALAEAVADEMGFSSGGGGGGNAASATEEEDANTNNNNNAKEEWEDLVREFHIAQNALHQAQEREQFLGVRYRSYQKQLQEQGERLREQRPPSLWATPVDTSDDEEGEGDDDIEDQPTRAARGGGDEEEATAMLARHNEDDAEEENNAAAAVAVWERRMEQWERDSDLLESVHEAHKQILVECETMRRTLRTLEERLQAHEQWRTECHTWVQRELLTPVPVPSAQPPPPNDDDYDDNDQHREDDLEAATAGLINEQSPETELCNLTPKPNT